MLKAKLAKEVVLRLQNDVGALHRVARLVSDKGVNILGTSTWVDHDQAVVHLITEDNLRTLDVLRAAGFSPHEADVVVTVVPNTPGLLRGITDKLAQTGIDLHHLYATAAMDQDHCLVVFASANSDRAVVVLNG